MAAKKTLYDTEVRDALQRGVRALARTLKVTLRPCGHVVVLARTGGA